MANQNPILSEKIARLKTDSEQQLKAKAEMPKAVARKRHFDFINYTWQRPDPFIEAKDNPFQREICSKIDNAVDKYRKGISSFICINVCFGHGKALEINTPIPTPSGWKRIVDLEPDDIVFDENGNQIKVKSKSEIFKDRDSYKVTSTDGYSVIADAAHEWPVRLYSQNRVYHNKTTEFLFNRQAVRRPQLKKHGPLQIESKPLPIDPYILGLWLGDGLLSNKNIPENYLWSDVKSRTDLLQGLMDTDGFISKDGQAEFCSTNKQLAEGVRHLVVSLGYKASFVTGTASLYGKDCGEKYRVMFYMPNSVTLPRKLARSKKNDSELKWPDRCITVEYYGKCDTVCIEVDSQLHQYLCGYGMFPTHNSDISSRYLPPHFLGEFPDAEVFVVSHTDDKANEFGDFGRSLVLSDEYRELYPHIQLSKSNHGVQEWGIDERFGKAQYFGIGSGTAGKRGNLIIVDDFFGKREHAESQALREKVWQSFTDDVMTRRAPVTIVLMVVTPWHVDDPIGRLKTKMSEDPDFPQFEFVNYPAFSDKYKTGKLFSERFSDEWYTSQSKFLGSYGTASLMQCDPQLKEGNMIRTDKIQHIDKSELPEGLIFVRAWDLASSVKQLQKNDPDFTSGCKMAVKRLPSAIKGIYTDIIYVADYVRGQWEATARNKTIIDTAIGDGYIRCGIEGFGAYKDAYTEIEGILKGIRVVEKKNLPGDKIAKASCLVPIFEAGNVYFVRGPWNEDVKGQIKNFPGGKHDDDVDSLAVGYAMCTERTMPQVFVI